MNEILEQSETVHPDQSSEVYIIYLDQHPNQFQEYGWPMQVLVSFRN